MSTGVYELLRVVDGLSTIIHAHGCPRMSTYRQRMCTGINIFPWTWRGCRPWIVKECPRMSTGVRGHIQGCPQANLPLSAGVHRGPGLSTTINWPPMVSTNCPRMSTVVHGRPRACPPVSIDHQRTSRTVDGCFIHGHVHGCQWTVHGCPRLSTTVNRLSSDIQGLSANVFGFPHG